MRDERGLVAVIGGPTASGKSGLALGLAERFGGRVINADSMQLYRELAILTARPEAADEALAPHRLYGVWAASERGSVARWRDAALSEIRDALTAGALPVLVGGTGLYIRSLMEGLVDLPEIPEEIRARGRALYAEMGGEVFRAALIVRDPENADLAPADVTRLTRAWEVLEATGRSLRVWRREATSAAPEDLEFLPFVLDPPREALYAACERRFDVMMERGALEEVRAFVALGLDPELPANRALGVPELRRVLTGEWTLPHAMDKARQATRNYAKRQATWFRHQLPQAIRPAGAGALDAMCAEVERRLGEKRQ